MTGRIENSLKNALNKELIKDEKLVWVGAPDASVIFAQQDIFLIPFTFLWGGFALFWESSVIAQTLAHGVSNLFSLILPLWGIPFVLVGLYLMFGRFFVKRKLKENTIYGITNKRVIVLQMWPSNKVISEDLQSLGPITKTGNEERGNLVFGENGGTGSLTGMEVFINTGYRKSSMNTLGFFDLPRPREAYDIVSRARQITEKRSDS